MLVRDVMEAYLSSRAWIHCWREINRSRSGRGRRHLQTPAFLLHLQRQVAVKTHTHTHTQGEGEKDTHTERGRERESPTVQ